MKPSEAAVDAPTGPSRSSGTSWRRPSRGTPVSMTSLAKATSRTRRAALVALLVAVPLLPLAGCGDDSGGGDAEVENEDGGGQEDDGGAY